MTGSSPPRTSWQRFGWLSGTATNLRNMRQFYLVYPALPRVESLTARGFYEIEAIGNNWAARELERQINSLL